MTAEIVKFKPQHLEMLGRREKDFTIGPYEDVIPYAMNSHSWSAILHGKVAACFGIMSGWPGVAEIWSITGAAADEHPILFHRVALTLPNQIMAHYGLDRLQAVCRADNLRSCKWLEALGFKKEGVMKKYDALGLDNFMYARVL